MPLPERAADTSPEHPWPVRLLSLKIGEYIEKMSVVWVEGQVVQLDRRAGTAYLTLRDVDVDMSFNVAIATNALEAMARPISPGERVVVQVKPAFWNKRGSLTLDARQIRPVGIGELLARLDYLKRTLAAEGLFAPERKKSLPFLPHTIGLITGRASAAERDVVENARRRWPGIRFEIRAVPVQGSAAAVEVCSALADLDALPQVEVIVIARGGGSIEDLLAFSNETLVRAVAAARTPVISAIGHDIDTPILDLVADVRASTPTHAASLVVPDAAALRAQLDQDTARLRRLILEHVQRERRRLVELTSRPVLTDRTTYIRSQRIEIATMRRRGQLRLEALVARDRDRIEHLRRQARMLSPQATLDRGYALVTDPGGQIITDQDQVAVDDLLRVRVARGDFPVRASAT